MQTPPLPTEAEMLEIVEQRARASIRANYRQLDDSSRSVLDQYSGMAEILTMNSDGLRALAMLLDDFYQGEVHNSAEKADAAGTKSPPVDEVEMGKIAQSLMEKMQSRDKLQAERMVRFEPLVESLSMSGQGFHALTMLLHQFHQQMVGAPKQKKERPEKKHSAKKSEKGRGKPRGRKSKR